MVPARRSRHATKEKARHLCYCPLSSELGTYKTVKGRFWPWLSGKSHCNLSSFPLSKKPTCTCNSERGEILKEGTYSLESRPLQHKPNILKECGRNRVNVGVLVGCERMCRTCTGFQISASERKGTNVGPLSLGRGNLKP